jgi:signal peptidase I
MQRKLSKLIITLFLFISIIIFRFFIGERIVVVGDSMLDYYANGKVLFANKLTFSVNRLDVVVADIKHLTVIKRVIGLPGETVSLINGCVYINGVLLDDTFGVGNTYPADIVSWTLNTDEYFLLGDNRLISTDSRYYGSVYESQIKGKILFQIFPFW